MTRQQQEVDDTRAPIYPRHCSVCGDYARHVAWVEPLKVRQRCDRHCEFEPHELCPMCGRESQARLASHVTTLMIQRNALRRVLRDIQHLAEVHDGNGKLADIARRAHAALNR
jgi:hypothetical protein